MGSVGYAGVDGIAGMPPSFVLIFRVRYRAYFWPTKGSKFQGTVLALRSTLRREIEVIIKFFFFFFFFEGTGMERLDMVPGVSN